MSWGPWIEHDGKGCPCVGAHVMVDYGNPLTRELKSTNYEIPRVVGDWGWRDDDFPSAWAVFRYRIKKPRGLTILERIAEQPQDERVGA